MRISDLMKKYVEYLIISHFLFTYLPWITSSYYRLFDRMYEVIKSYNNSENSLIYFKHKGVFSMLDIL